MDEWQRARQERLKASRERAAAKHKERKAGRPDQEWLWSTLAGCRRRALDKGRDFDLKPEDLLPLPKVCPILGIRIGEVDGQWVSPSIDRIDSSKGLHQGQCLDHLISGKHVKEQCYLG